ncbi:ligand-binding protein SH3 [Candidatus Peregrinibacteria bacterium]|nr:ligand-binding protein SH3 [Candidatus Peregrinibacteria bacterium]
MNIPPEYIVFFSSMLPVTELRGAIPLGFAMGLPAESIFVWALIGNILPCFFILWVLGPISAFLMRHSAFFERLFTKLFDKTRTKHQKNIIKYGPLFLIIFVAIPLPGSGGWTGSLLAFLFGMPYWKSMGYITAGLTMAALIITFSINGVVGLF